MTEKTNFDRYLERKLANPEFRARFEDAGRACMLRCNSWRCARHVVSRSARSRTCLAPSNRPSRVLKTHPT